jgi:ABC-type siderophore export system fused ATPase/permease subunit
MERFPNVFSESMTYAGYLLDDSASSEVHFRGCRMSRGALISWKEECDIHAIVDNYATDKHPKVRRWLARQDLSLHANLGIVAQRR